MKTTGALKYWVDLALNYNKAITKANPSTLKRAKNPMPANVKAALSEHVLLDAYEARPPYQQNDYLGWTR